MKDEAIFRISEVDFCEIPNNKINKFENVEEDQIRYIKDGISKLLKLGFYYSFGLDLTNSQQNHFKILYALKKQKQNNNNNNNNDDDEELDSFDLNLIEKKMKNIFKNGLELME